MIQLTRNFQSVAFISDAANNVVATLRDFPGS